MWLLANATFSRSQNSHKARTLCTTFWLAFMIENSLISWMSFLRIYHCAVVSTSAMQCWGLWGCCVLEQLCLLSFFLDLNEQIIRKDIWSKIKSLSCKHFNIKRKVIFQNDIQFLTTFTQLNARLKNFLGFWLLVLCLQECLVEYATLCVKSVVILWTGM